MRQTKPTAQLELQPDGIFLRWDNGVVSGPFASLSRAEEFLDWCDFQQRCGRTVDINALRAVGPGLFSESFDPC